jgi:hypothetical protein
LEQFSCNDEQKKISPRKLSLAVSYGNEPPVANIVQFLFNNSLNLTHPNADINSEYVFAFQLKFCEQILHEVGRGGNQSILIAFLFCECQEWK